MAQQGNIVDFNEARVASSARHARIYADDWANSMANSDRRRSRAAARNSSASDGSSVARSSHRSWLDQDFESATTSRRRSDRYSSQSISGFDTMSSSTARNTGGVPNWLADAYADLDDAKAQSTSAFGAASAPAARSASGFSRRDDSVFANDDFDIPAFEPTASSRRRPTTRSAQRSRRAGGSPTTWDDGFDYEDTPRSAVFDEDALREEAGDDTAKGGLFAKLKGLKKAATKDKAGRQFERQFGGESRSNAEEAGPRAALYKGEMGQQQRYAQRLQQDAAPERGTGSAFSSRRGDARQANEDNEGRATRKARRSHPVLKIGAAVFALIICAGFFMYPTVQSYYQTIREYDRLEAERQAIEQRNEALEHSISSLSSNEGVAAYAHDQYGWIKPGEQTATVQGLELSPRDGLENVNASVPTGSVKAPETWYSPVLDKFFGVE